ncbi:MAG TPA: cob(I)yrinic acid a,c-diamide adenosyltransferase [Candidatus Eremiobacteraeota bacterium]|nr:cob(I)yrinic acid a,c-diamide adenosyltransferase [Candidatus Eremiobacteraeota bacterium]
MIQVYTGNGKGKTTASLGLAFRALGEGLKVYMIQFMKGYSVTGEYKMAEKTKNFTMVYKGRNAFINKTEVTEEDRRLAREGMNKAREVISSGKYDLLILDEINLALDYKLIPLEDLLEVLRLNPAPEIVLTGRNVPEEILEIADLVTEMREIKHYYNKGVKARKGFEY